ncbi:MAG: glycosyltransferase family 2 protein [Bacteroidaceae bacterium]
MKVSVIIPYYNPAGDTQTEKLLRRAIASASENLFEAYDYEIIVVNDGSPYDPSLESLSGLPLKYVSRPHGKQGAARNTGIENATGQIITFLDADDCYYPNSLAPCIEHMKSSGSDLLGFGMVRLEGSQNCSDATNLKPAFDPPVTGDSFMLNHILSGSACRYLISRSLIENHHLRFMENAYIEDEEFTPRLMFLSRRYVNTDFPVYAYYIRSGSIITDVSPQMLQAKSDHTLKALSGLISFRDKHSDEPHQGLDRKINILAMDHIRRTLRRKDWREVISQQTDALAQMNLFPLRFGHDKAVFKLFSLLSRCRIGLNLLHLTEKKYR